MMKSKISYETIQKNETLTGFFKPTKELDSKSTSND
jgi:hypothetical protein